MSYKRKYTTKQLDIFFSELDRGASTKDAALLAKINRNSAGLFKREYQRALILFPESPRLANGRPRKMKTSRKMSPACGPSVTAGVVEPAETSGYDNLGERLREVREAIVTLTETLQEDMQQRRTQAVASFQHQSEAATAIVSALGEIRDALQRPIKAQSRLNGTSGNKPYSGLHDKPLAATSIKPDAGESLSELLDTYLDDMLQCVEYNLNTEEIAEELGISTDAVCRIRGSREFSDSLDAQTSDVE